MLNSRTVPFAKPTASTLMRVCGSEGGVREDSGVEMVRAIGAAWALEDWDWACAACECSWCSANWRARLRESGLEALRMRAKMDHRGSSDSDENVDSVCERSCASD